MTLENLNLGVAQTVCKELKTIRSLKVRIDKYDKYARINRLQAHPKIYKLKNALQYIYSKLTQSGESSPCYTLPTYDKLRLTVNKLLKEEGYLWEQCTGKPWLGLKIKNFEVKDRLLDLRLKSLEAGKIESRKKELKWRLAHEILHKYQKGHYIIFNTLTVNPWHYSDVWENGSKIWSNFILRLKRLCECAPSYFAVRETGELNGRLHIHCILILEKMPNMLKSCPNDSTLVPVNREIEPLKKLWPYGISQPIAVRFNMDDAFSRLNWRWPVDDNGAIDNTNPLQMASYLAKYINKEPKKGVKRWKTKVSRNLGLQGIQEAMKILTFRELEILATLQTNRLIQLDRKVIPRQILIKEATREILRRKPNPNLLTQMTPQPSIIEQWRDLTAPLDTHNWQKCINSRMRNMKEIKSFEVNMIVEKIQKAVKCVYNPCMDDSSRHIKNPHKRSIGC